jgi:hypothetical protein
MPPVCFISYSWDSERHKTWVRELATALRDRGVKTLLDQWDCRPGDDFGVFMERGIEQADVVLVICTPTILQKQAKGQGGVFFEAKMIRAELFLGSNKRFIPILREGRVANAVPPALRTTVMVDFSDDRRYDEALDELTGTLLGQSAHETPPVRDVEAPAVAGPARDAEPARPIRRTRTTPVRAFDAFFSQLDGVHRRLHPVKVRVFYGLAAGATLLLLLSGGALVRQALQPGATSMNAVWLLAVMLALLLSLAAVWLYRNEERCEQSVAWCRVAQERDDHHVAARAVGVLTCYGWLKRQFQDELREFTK